MGTISPVPARLRVLRAQLATGSASTADVLLALTGITASLVDAADNLAAVVKAIVPPAGGDESDSPDEDPPDEDPSDEEPPPEDPPDGNPPADSPPSDDPPSDESGEDPTHA